jgi:hypothetical protein
VPQRLLASRAAHRPALHELGLRAHEPTGETV